MIRTFYARLNSALAAPQPPLEDRRPDELAADFRRLESQLLTHWDAPLINDFFAMIHYGLLRQLCVKWCGDAGDSLHNDLLCGEGGMISAEPVARIREMAASVLTDVVLVTLLSEGTLEQILAALPRYPALHAQYLFYLDKFADRCLDELKLESPTLQDDPLPLLRSVGALAQRGASLPASMENEMRRRAEQAVAAALAKRPFRRVIFHWILRQARGRVRDRENLRFERTRLFGRIRRIFVELGRRFHADNRLVEPRDIFYLELAEILGFIEGTATTTDLKGLVALRQQEFACHRAAEPPSDRFETRGIVNHGNLFQPVTPAVEMTGGEQRKGIGCCPGIVRGPVRVVRDPRGVALQPGEILVAERTDPGWVMIFPAAAGLLVERGSLLSHSAIVARELGLPAIVAIPGVTRWLRDGDVVELNGSTGVVRRVMD